MSGVRVTLVVIGALVLQVCLFARFSYEGARPDLLVLLAIAGGFVAGPERGAIIGFASGIAFDVVLATPFGLSAFVYTLVGYAVGRSVGGVVRTSRWIAPVVAAVASAGAMVGYALAGLIVDVPTLDGPSLTAIVVVVSAVNALLAPLAAGAVRWTSIEGVDRRRQPLWVR